MHVGPERAGYRDREKKKCLSPERNIDEGPLSSREREESRPLMAVWSHPCKRLDRWPCI